MVGLRDGSMDTWMERIYGCMDSHSSDQQTKIAELLLYHYDTGITSPKIFTLRSARVALCTIFEHTVIL